MRMTEKGLTGMAGKNPVNLSANGPKRKLYNNGRKLVAEEAWSAQPGKRLINVGVVVAAIALPGGCRRAGVRRGYMRKTYS
ncbi:hypothetical protein GCM10011430_04540 [Oxalicibacterium solurbis]|uniref:Uncharacterized protein n=1 Tax=Oxalicibacterium solurbis TaxID=69280 RepID=A0A8J3B1U0_9BURK|nr:hypothetical protein GCM10011430_04540 [Oxalicibacterium solurbis]